MQSSTIALKGETKVLFRLSFRFYQGYEEFKQHWKNWNQLYESDGRINDLQGKEPFVSKLNAFRKMYQLTSPDTIVFSSGLWKLDCNAASMAYKNLMSEMNENGVNNILFFTPGHLKYHPSITNNAVRKVRDCIVATRDKELYDLHSSSTPYQFLMYLSLRRTSLIIHGSDTVVATTMSQTMASLRQLQKLLLLHGIVLFATDITKLPNPIEPCWR